MSKQVYILQYNLKTTGNLTNEYKSFTNKENKFAKFLGFIKNILFIFLNIFQT